MSKKAGMVLIMIAVVVLLGITRGSTTLSAQDGGGVSPQAVMTPLLQYQGRLTDPGGTPLDGTYQISFRLYNVASGGSPLWTETEPVPVQGGLLNSVLGDSTPLSMELFDGQALWLAVQVEGDAEATPRQPVLPVAYAMSLVPGAVIGGPIQVNGDLALAGAFDSPHASDPDAHHPAYTDTQAWSAVLNRDGPSSGLNADLLDNYDSSQLFALSESETVTGIPRLYGGTSGSTPPFYVDSTYLVRDLNADYLDGYTSSDFVRVSNKTRYVPITVGDLMHSMNDTVNSGDCCNGILFPDGSQSGGSITFPLPTDYVYGTTFQLDLYLIPLDAGSGALDFYVRWVGLTTAGWSGTGSSTTTTAASLGTVNYVHKQTFTLAAFTAGSAPELVELTIRRNSGDSYAGRVTLVGLRLAYQASY